MPWVLRGLRGGIVTTGYPARRDEYGEYGVRSVAEVVGHPLWDSDIAALCPTGAITEVDGAVRLDRGRCIGCGECVRSRTDVFSWQSGSEVARLNRDLLVVPERAESDAELEHVRHRLALRTKVFRHSVHIRHIDTGSDGAIEWEIQALLNPIYDVHRLGIYFTASPRHADILLVTGAGTHGMAQPLARTLEAMPRPLVVIAAGSDAISGALVSPSYATDDGVGAMVPVDVWVPGSPPTPFALLHAILLATGRLGDRKGVGK